MAEKSRLERAKAQATQSQKKRKGNFFKETWSELKKVHWPTKANVVKYTIVVLVFVAIMGVVLAAVDGVLNLGMQQLPGYSEDTAIVDNSGVVDNTDVVDTTDVNVDTGADTDANTNTDTDAGNEDAGSDENQN